MEEKCDLTILLPIYNPPPGWADTVRNSLDLTFQLLREIDVKVMLVNDGSTVNLEEEFSVLRQLGDKIRYISYARNRGKGYAIREGLRTASSEFYIYTDWDFPFGEESVYRAYQILQSQNADLVVGVRSKSYFASLPLFRKVISQGLRVLSFFVLEFKYIDTQAGIKGLSNAARAVFLTNKTNSFIFELEFIRDCFRRRLNVLYLSVSHKSDITFSNFSLKTVSREMAVLMRLIFT